MALSRDKKAVLLEKLSTVTADAGSVVFVHAAGVTIPETDALRSELRNAGSTYQVVKKTLLKLALEKSGFTGVIPELPGEIAIAYGPDLTAPARIVHENAGKLKDKMSIVGGIFEGAFMDQSSMMAIATIPPTPVLRGMFVNVINSPIQGMVIALSKIAEKKSA